MADQERGTMIGRRTITTGLLAGGVTGLLLSSRQARAGSKDPAIPQPADFTAAAAIARAFEMRDLAIRTGDQGFGAVVVKGGRIVGQAPSRVIVDQDPTAHAETEAIRDAAHRLGSRNLAGCSLYSSSRACPMCEVAAFWAGIEPMHYGQAVNAAGRPQLRRC